MHVPGVDELAAVLGGLAVGEAARRPTASASRWRASNTCTPMPTRFSW